MDRTPQPESVPSASATDAAWSTRLRWSVFLVLVVLLGFYVVRGPYRGALPDHGTDFSMLYAASTSWAQGANPYSGQDCVEVLADRGGGALVDNANPQKFASLYPPTMFPVLSPLALVDWPTARVLWAVLNGLAGLASIPLLLKLLGHRSARWAAVIAATVLIWAPLHTAAGVGQPMGLLLFLILLAVTLRLRGAGEVIPGLCLGLAVLIKPQIGLPFVVLLGWERRWLALGASLGVSAAVTGLSIARLQMTTPTWRADLAHNLAILTDPAGGIGSPSPNNPLVYQMIDTAPILYRFGVAEPWVGPAVWGIALVAAALALMWLSRYRWPDRQLLLIAGLAAVPLLPVYHRMYDATLLLLVAVWVYKRWAMRPGDRWAALAGLCLVPFLLPGPAILSRMMRGNLLPMGLADNWWWQTFVMQHHSWFALLLIIALLGAVAAGRRAAGESDPRAQTGPIVGPG